MSDSQPQTEQETKKEAEKEDTEDDRGVGEAVDKALKELDEKRQQAKAIVDRAAMKPLPFIGGFRDKRSGVEYHHAAVQTDPPPPSAEEVRRRMAQRFHRTTQTNTDRWSHSTSGTQTQRETATQMPRRGLYIETLGDREVAPRPYETADELDRKRHAAALRIQCLMRGYSARKLAARLRSERGAKLEELAAREEELARRERREREAELERRRNPTTAADFELLRSELAQWGTIQREKLAELDLTPEQRQEAEAEVVRKEARLMQRVDRVRAKRIPQDREALVKRKIDKICAPVKVGEGGAVVVETEATRKAAQLRELFEALSAKPGPTEARTDVLSKVQDLVQDHPCALSRDIIDLAERERTLLGSGLTENLDGLRKRLSNLFFQFIENPEFNPQAAVLGQGVRSNTLPLNPRTGRAPPLSTLPRQAMKPGAK